MHTVFLDDEDATLRFGVSWANCLNSPLVIYLNGTLGAGKTTFVRGLLRGLGYQGAVKSPTYAVVESYAFASFELHHFDLYRFASPEEWDETGLSELFTEKTICLIEWPQQGGDYVPAADIHLDFSSENGTRRCTIRAVSSAGGQALASWSTQL